MLTLQFNEEVARKLVAIYPTSDVVAQRRATLERLALSAGETVLDVGCGPGFLCADMAVEVGRTGRVVGIDISEDFLRMARRQGKRDWVTFARGDIRALHANNASFDVAVSTQVLEYVSDPTRGIAELYRVLRPGGRVLVVDTDWDGMVWHTAEPARMERVRNAWEAHCVDPRLPRTLGAQLRSAGFSEIEASGFAIINTRLHPDTYSHGMIGLISDFVGRKGSVSQEELEDWATELRGLNAEGRYFFSIVRYLFRARKPEH